MANLPYTLGGQFGLESGGQFDRFFHLVAQFVFIRLRQAQLDKGEITNLNNLLFN